MSSILLVMNDEIRANEIKQTLHVLENVNVHIAANIDDFINRIKQQHFALIFIEEHVDNIDAWRLVRLIRTGVANTDQNTPIALLIDRPYLKIIRSIMSECGANSFCLKSDSNCLLETARNYVKKAPQADPLQKTVLAIDDDKDILQLIVRFLGKHYTVETFSNPMDGAFSWQKKRHHVVLVDLMMASKSGGAILEEVLKIDPWQPVVLMTAYPSIDLAAELITKGAADFIPKPFRQEQLKKACDLALKRNDCLLSTKQYKQQLAKFEGLL